MGCQNLTEQPEQPLYSSKFIEKRRQDLNQLMKSESAGQRPVARPLMNFSEGPPLLTPVLSGKEKGKLSDLKNEGKKRKFAAQQLASLRTGDRLQTDEFDEMARHGVENSTII